MKFLLDDVVSRGSSTHSHLSISLLNLSALCDFRSPPVAISLSLCLSLLIRRLQWWWSTILLVVIRKAMEVWETGLSEVNRRRLFLSGCLETQGRRVVWVLFLPEGCQHSMQSMPFYLFESHT